jgi:hypothetical protein
LVWVGLGPVRAVEELSQALAAVPRARQAATVRAAVVVRRMNERMVCPF